METIIRNFDPKVLEGAEQIMHNVRRYVCSTKAEAEAFIKGFQFAVTETGISVLGVTQGNNCFIVRMDEITA